VETAWVAAIEEVQGCQVCLQQGATISAGAYCTNWNGEERPLNESALDCLRKVFSFCVTTFGPQSANATRKLLQRFGDEILERWLTALIWHRSPTISCLL
jgi:hypothetical protein